MTRIAAKNSWRHRIARLKRLARSGDVAAMSDLGLTLLEGIQDRQGKSLVRRNPAEALLWLREAADRGNANAAVMVGYAHDVGLGTRPDAAMAIRWYRRAVKAGSSMAASNLATVYRDAGKPRLAVRWWVRALAMGDGDAAVDVGYCYQYGIGTRKNPDRAKQMYRRAIASTYITQYQREAALYHLALQSMDDGDRRSAIRLLRKATMDEDYPEAASVLRQVESRSEYVPCRCKRLINKRLRGHAECMLHPRRGQSGASARVIRARKRKAGD